MCPSFCLLEFTPTWTMWTGENLINVLSGKGKIKIIPVGFVRAGVSDCSDNEDSTFHDYTYCVFFSKHSVQISCYGPCMWDCGKSLVTKEIFGRFIVRRSHKNTNKTCLCRSCRFECPWAVLLLHVLRILTRMHDGSMVMWSFSSYIMPQSKMLMLQRHLPGGFPGSDEDQGTCRTVIFQFFTWGFGEGSTSNPKGVFGFLNLLACLFNTGIASS